MPWLEMAPPIPAPKYPKGRTKRRGAPLHSLRDGYESGAVDENDLQRDGKASE